MTRPNIIFLTVDQLAAQVLSCYGGDVVATPNLDRFAAEGVTFDQMISTCPVCTPYRSMWLTGRHPQTTGHVLNFVNTRHDEIGWGDVFAHAGYDTGYIGKWHLHRGSFPEIEGRDFVPEGRDRLGFRWWRGYNFHTDYFNGSVNLDDWRCERWEGYETEALNRYAFTFLDQERDPDKPFCLLINPHQPHGTHAEFAPQNCFDRLPADLDLPPHWHGSDAAFDRNAFRVYLAMVIAIDDMLGALLDGLDERGLRDDTIVVFTTDHGTHLSIHEQHFWGKKMPWEENVRVPFVIRWPGVFEGGGRNAVLTAPVDLLPTFCGLCDVPVPRSVEGYDLSAAWRGEPGAFEQEAVLMMNFHAHYDHLDNGWEWRGVRTRSHTYARFLDGRELLYDLDDDPWQERNLIDEPAAAPTRDALLDCLAALQQRRGDQLLPAAAYQAWFDSQRRVIANGYGRLGHPEDQPDWSLLVPRSA